jgi:predicted transposase YdaD
MSDAINNPHDKFFKDIFTQKEAAQSFLETYLPPDVRAILAVEDLEIRKDSFIDGDLQEHFLNQQTLTEKGAELMGTIAEMWIEEGILKGREEGLQEGRREGLQEGRQEGLALGERQALLESLERILAFRFEQVPPAVSQTLPRFQRDQLKHLSEVVFKVDTLAEFVVALEALPLDPPPEAPA